MPLESASSETLPEMPRQEASGRPCKSNTSTSTEFAPETLSVRPETWSERGETFARSRMPVVDEDEVSVFELEEVSTPLEDEVSVQEASGNTVSPEEFTSRRLLIVTCSQREPSIVSVKVTHSVEVAVKVTE